MSFHVLNIVLSNYIRKAVGSSLKQSHESKLLFIISIFTLGMSN